jgi:hypothetical protein
MSIRERVYFVASDSEKMEIVPQGVGEIAVSYDNRESRPLSINIKINCPEIKELNKVDVTPNYKGNELGTYKIPFKVSADFADTITIEVSTQPRTGLGSFGSSIINKTKLLLVPLIMKTTNIMSSDDQTKILEGMQGKALILVPDESAKPTTTPVIGDVNIQPLISIGLPTTSGIVVMLQCSARALKILENTAKNAGAQLDNVSSDQLLLQFFINDFKKYASKLPGAKVEGPTATAHVKISGAGATYLMMVTQVSPKEDERVGKDIQAIVDEGRRTNSSVTVVVTALDSTLMDIAKSNIINVIDVFHGLEVRGVWMGDPLIQKYLKERLELDLVAYTDKISKNYTPSVFEEAINKIKVE